MDGASGVSNTSHFINAKQGNGYLRVKTQSVHGLDSPVFSPKGVEFSTVQGNVKPGAQIVDHASTNSFHRGRFAGDTGYIAFEFQDTTHNDQLDYGWVNLSVTDDSYDSMNINIASYAYDQSGRELPTGATTDLAPTPEASPAMALAVLSALTLGAAGVRRMKDLRA